MLTEGIYLNAGNDYDIFGYKGSEFVREIRGLPENLQNRLPIDAYLPDLFDIVMGMVKTIVNPNDNTEIIDALSDFFSKCDEQTLSEATKALYALAKNGSSMKLLKRLANQKEGHIFLQRTMGKKALSLETALKRDLAFLITLFSQTIHGIMPIIAAWEDTLEILSEEQRMKIAEVMPLSINLLQVAIEFENDFSSEMLRHLPAEMIVAAQSQMHVLGTDKFLPEVNQIKDYLKLDGENRIAQINEPLVRKFKGAATALNTSEDGVSQASSSLIELVDRMLRDFATKAEVVIWLRNNSYLTEETIYKDQNGSTCPTKLGESLCFLYGKGQTPTAISGEDGTAVIETIYYYLAKSFVAARNTLQKIKHADNDTQEERELVTKCANAILGVVEFAHRFGWIYQGADTSDKGQLP